MIYIYSKRLLKEVYVTRGDDFQARITESLPFDDGKIKLVTFI